MAEPNSLPTNVKVGTPAITNTTKMVASVNTVNEREPSQRVNGPTPPVSSTMQYTMDQHHPPPNCDLEMNIRVRHLSTKLYDTK